MQMLTLVFRSSLRERAHALLQQCGVRAYTELPETIGAGQTGPAEGLGYQAGVNSVILLALEEPQLAAIEGALKAWFDEANQRPGWQEPSLCAFAWPCRQLV